jgi:hypothetical protein
MPQVAGLSVLVSQLCETVHAKPGGRVKTVALSQPDNVTVTKEDVSDVFDFLGIKNLMLDKLDPLFSQLFVTLVAFAGYNKGLCRNYTDVYACEKEEYFFPSRWTLFLDYSQDSLSGGFDLVQEAHMFRVRNKFVDSSLGIRQLSAYKDEDVYRAKVATGTREFVKSTRREVQELVLTGDSASDPRFHTALHNALADSSSGQGSVVQGPKDFELLKQIDQPTFLHATTNGAADFAKRRQEGMARCRLPEKCGGSENETATSEEL